MIDLHAHTTFSDGTLTPAELVQLARECGLTAVAITDHDTLAGYDEAARLEEIARQGNAKALDLVCGIELTTKLGRSSVHVLGYFVGEPPSAAFCSQLKELYEQRKDRNVRLIGRLQELGIAIELEEVEAVGRYMTGRPHFAAVLVAKGYAASYDDAFARYLSEDGAAYVVREAPSVPDGIRWIREAGGISSLAHPIRLRLADDEPYIRELTGAGLQALEVFHTDHSAADSARYLRIAKELGLLVTGGSDYHGSIKPNVRLGSRNVPDSVLTDLRIAAGSRQ